MGWPSAWRIARDDAGQWRRVVNPRFRRALARAEAEHRARLLGARAELARAWWIWPIVLGVLMLVMWGRFTIFGVPGGVGWRLLWPLGVLAAVIVISHRFGSGILDGSIRQVALKYDLCPSCAGDLAASEVDPATGRVRCAGCGGEWVRPGTRRAVCGRCRYNLYGVAPGEDGVTRCPECGAGWRFGEALHAAEKAECEKEGRGGG